MGAPATSDPSCVELVGSILENYANKGVFRGFSRGPIRNGKAGFKMLWHRDQLFEVILDLRKATLRFPIVLPNVPARSPMYRAFKDFVESFHSTELPEHRRIDPARATFSFANRAGNVGLTMQVLDGDYEYAVRKLIHLIHETYLVFLADGLYFDWLVETFDLDPDHM